VIVNILNFVASYFQNLQMMDDIYAKLVELNQSHIRSVLCLIISTAGSVPRKAGAKMVVTETGDIFGTIGGGKIEQQVQEKALEIMHSNTPELLKLDLENDAEMQCGGSVEVYLEQSNPASELYIFGAGHVGSALAQLANNFGFDVTAVDNRKDLLKQMADEGIKTIDGEFEQVAENLSTGPQTYIVVTTPRHESDFNVTGILAGKKLKYLGMIGSAKKVKQAAQTFKEKFQLTDEIIQNIDMPIGIHFNAQTPREIAISILAKIIHVHNS
jgi:xanthine dehydrogenase accessory factor